MGLQNEDLKHLVYDIFEVDAYKSKMGTDKDIVTVSFSVKDGSAAKDLENFIEKGYPFVLDADSTDAEQRDGNYKVFVEMERNKEAPKNILEMVYGISKLTGLEGFKFRYHKNFKSIPVDENTLIEEIPVDAEGYEAKTSGTTMENYKNFFSKSYLESSNLEQNMLTLKRKFADPVRFEVIDFGPIDKLDITESIDPSGFAEVIWLTKYVGDYNITKYKSNTVFENNGYRLILRRLI